jgi:hypothetical protein
MKYIIPIKEGKGPVEQREAIMIFSFQKHALETCLKIDVVSLEITLGAQLYQLLKEIYDWSIFFFNQKNSESLITRQCPLF